MLKAPAARLSNLFEGPKARTITAQGNALGYLFRNEISPEWAA